MQRKQKFSVIFMLLATPYLLMTACDSEEQKKQNAEWEAQASENAQGYVQEKYGFTAEIKEAKVDRQQGMFGTTPLSDVLVEMTHDGRDFTVYITGLEVSTEGCDTYQAEEIKQAWFDTLNAEIGGLRLLDIYPQYKSERDVDEPLYSTYFDGSNLAEVLEDGARQYYAYYVQTDFSDEKDFAWLRDYHINGNFVSCRDDEILDAERLTRDWAAPQPVYCDNSRELNYSGGKARPVMTYHAYELHQYGDFYYYVNSYYNYDKGEPYGEQLQLSKVTAPDPNLFNGWGSYQASVISEAYSVSADESVFVHVYYPVSKLDTDKKPENYNSHFDCATIRKDKDSAAKYRSDPVRGVGDYIYIQLEVDPDDPCTFVFLYDP